MLINVVIHKIKYYHLQIRCIKLHIAHLFNNYFLDLVAVLLDLVLALLLGDVLTGEPLLHVAQRLDGLLLALVADLSGLLLAVLGVAVLLGFLRTSLHLQLADLLGLEVAILLLDWEGEDVGELLAVSVDIGLAHLNLDLSWARSGNFASPRGRGRCWRTSRSICGHRSCTPQLGSFLGSKWQFCFSTGKGKMLENFSQYLWTSVLHTSTWIFGNVVAILLRGSSTYDLFLTVAIVLG